MTGLPQTPGQEQTPWQRYQADLTERGFVPDAGQEQAVRHLQTLYEQLLQPAPSAGLLGRLFGSGQSATIKGLYLWGGVGRGKTWLMDCFYECLPLASKRRVHFHRFMEDVHDRLKAHKGEADPLDAVAAELLADARVLCFDEFFVVDIADAMILARLLQLLFDGGMVLVATSNIPPDQLYRDGLQRAKFVPAIELLQQHTLVVNVDSGVDYRLRILEKAEIYHHPLDAGARASLEDSMRQLAPGEIKRDQTLSINHRPLPCVAVSDGLVWCEFSQLCEAARSSSDYIELSRRFNTVLLANVPQMAEGSNDPARRFITLVDELYDRQVNLIMSAAVPLDQLYAGKRLAFEFRRTLSRLIEMQSHDYLATEHRP